MVSTINKKKPILIISAGMIRSGSTLLYLILQGVLGAKNKRILDLGSRKVKDCDLTEYVEYDFILVKLHDFDEVFFRLHQKMNILVFYSYRDPRGVIQSLMLKENKTFEQIFSFDLGSLVSDHSKWMEVAFQSFNYESLYHDLRGSITQIAESLEGVATEIITELEKNLSISTLKGKLQHLKFDQTSKNASYNRRYQLHHNHINNGNPRSWIGFFSKDQRLLLNLSFYRFLRYSEFKFYWTFPGRFFFKNLIFYLANVVHLTYRLKRVKNDFIRFRYILHNKIHFSQDNLILYRGYKVYHEKNDQLVKLLISPKHYETSIYESSLTNKLSAILKKYESPIFLDIGSNIGLISLNIAKTFKNVKIYGFEAGITQYRYFQKTIIKNRLEDKITSIHSAIYNKNGFINFCVHNDGHSSGDGILDTKRAGDYNSIQVPSLTLDSWWSDNNFPKVSVIKLDIEGAELYALQGANKLIQSIRPYLILEYSHLNIKAYDYHPEELLQFLRKKRYHLYTLDNQLLLQGKEIEFFQDNQHIDTIVAHP